MPNATCSICFEDLVLGGHRRRGRRKRATDNDDDHDGGGGDNKSDSGDQKGEISATPCGHVFHTTCVSQWVAKNGHCPQCRRQVVVGDLVKLFLAEDLRRRGSERGGAKATSSSSSSSTVSSTPSPTGGSEERRRLLKEEEREEHRIIQDVLQCQLEDLEGDLRKARKEMGAMEEVIHEKVSEVSALEADLRRGAEAVEAGRREREEMREAFREAEKNNAELREQLYRAREETRRKDHEMRERERRSEEDRARIRLMEGEVRAKNEVIVEMQVWHKKQNIAKTDL